MKLYLATSSLNIDNILSTECVAPYSFYKARNYGYNSFCKLELVPFENVLIFFSRIPHFDLYDREHDSRPVILEIEVNEKINSISLLTEFEGTKVYSADSIIRLTPFNTRLLFFNPQDLNHSRLSCSDSLKNKLGDRFRFDFCRADFDLARLSSMNKQVEDTCHEYEKKVYQDNRLNVIKGFVFGYYLGVSRSVSVNSARLLKIQKRVYDIAATIRNSGGYGNNSFFDELEQLDKEYRRNDPSTIKCKELWEKTLQELGIPSDALNRLFELYDETGYVKTNFMKKQRLLPPVTLRQYGFNNIEAYRDNLKSHTTGIVREDQIEQLNSFDPIKTFDLDPSFETCMLAGEDYYSTIFNKFIDALLWHGIAPTPDKLRTDRFNIATEITKSAKYIWESTNQQWVDSSAQMFMNELRSNIKSFTPLDINKQENVILKSIAAFVLKGEDFDAIVQFCEDNSFSDYRYALAFWGATMGYVKISKPIMSCLTKNVSFGKTFKDIITLLYNLESVGDLPNVQETVRVVEKKEEHPAASKLRSEVHDVFNTLSPNQQRANANKIEQALALEADQGNFVAYLFILNNLISKRTSVYKTIEGVLLHPESKGKDLSALVNQVLCGFTAKKDQEYRHLAMKALELEDRIGDPESFCYMLDDLNIRKEIRDKFFKHFKIEPQVEHTLLDTLINVGENVGTFLGELFHGQSDQPETSESTKLSESNDKQNLSAKVSDLNESVISTGQFLTDINFLSTNIESLQLLSTCHDNWMQDLSWFIDAHKPDSKFEHYKSKPLDNSTVVWQFIHFRDGRYRRMEQFLRRMYR